jgi:hypothetical protein
MPNFERSISTGKSSLGNSYSYDKLLGVVSKSNDGSVFSRTSKISVTLKDTDNYYDKLRRMTDDEYKSAGGCDLSAIFLPFQSANASGGVPGFNPFLPVQDPEWQEVDMFEILPFEYASGVTNQIKDRWSAPSGDGLNGLLSSDSFNVDPNQYREPGDVRGIGLRLPIMGVGWGYTLDDEPWPPGSGVGINAKFKGQKSDGKELDPSDYIAAPIDFRFDTERGVWTALGGRVVRYKIIGPILEGIPAIGVCKKYNGVKVKGEPVPVALVAGQKVNDEIYAIRPAGGVIGTPLYEGLPVVWQEVARLPTGQHQFQHYQMVAQLVAGWDYPRGHPTIKE